MPSPVFCANVLIEEGTTIIVNGYLGVYGYNKKQNNVNLVSPVLKIQCTNFTISNKQLFYLVETNNHPKKLPYREHLKYIALITRENSEGCQDFLKPLSDSVLRKVLIYDAKLEGSEAIEMITYQILQANINPDVSVICIVRGGGERHHIDSVFNSIEVYNAIKACSKPVLVAIGHTGNITNADKISDAPLDAKGNKRYYTVPYDLGNSINLRYRERPANIPPKNTNQYNQTKTTYSNQNNQSQSQGSHIFCIFIIMCLLAYIFVTR